jgi:isocitrate dehydrogenase kinase/phosphatase
MGAGTIYKGKTRFVIYVIHKIHYLLKRSFMSDMKKNCINNIFFRNANILKFGELMNQTKLSKLKKLCVFIRFINNNVCPPG